MQSQTPALWYCLEQVINNVSLIKKLENVYCMWYLVYRFDLFFFYILVELSIMLSLYSVKELARLTLCWSKFFHIETCRIWEFLWNLMQQKMNVRGEGLVTNLFHKHEFIYGKYPFSKAVIMRDLGHQAQSKTYFNRKGKVFGTSQPTLVVLFQSYFIYINDFLRGV